MKPQCVSIPVVALAVAVLVSVTVDAQTDGNYKAPRTPWGEPDLQAVYGLVRNRDTAGCSGPFREVGPHLQIGGEIIEKLRSLSICRLWKPSSRPNIDATRTANSGRDDDARQSAAPYPGTFL